MRRTSWISITIGGFFGMTAVILGAAGSHAFKDSLSPEDFTTLTTAIHYQLIHAVLIVTISGFDHFSKNQWVRSAMGLIIFGIIFFSGSLILRVLSQGSIPSTMAPFGGICFILGWLSLCVGGIKELKTTKF